MLEGRLDQNWARWTRPWTTAAWAFLTCGIALGSWWAYYELGWGGFWFWDPVENASFMPWLVGTALDPFPGGDRQARALQELDAAARGPRLLAEPLGHVPGALGRAGLGAFLRGRSDARHLHPRVPGHHDRRRADALCLAGADVEVGRRASSSARASRSCSSTTFCWSSPRRRFSPARMAPLISDAARARHALGRSSVLQPDVHALDAAAARLLVAVGIQRQLEARPPGRRANACSSRPRRRRRLGCVVVFASIRMAAS